MPRKALAVILAVFITMAIPIYAMQYISFGTPQNEANAPTDSIADADTETEAEEETEAETEASEETEEEEEEEEEEKEGRVVILLYHDLVEKELGENNNPEYCTTGEKFRLDLETLLSHGWKSISSEMYVKGEYDKSENYFIVTFDDGYISNYTIAYPIMLELGVYGDIFTCTGNVHFDNHFKWDQGQEMENSGYVKLYSHTHRHYSLTRARTLFSFQTSIKTSLLYMRYRLAGDRMSIFSYPESDYTEESVRALYESGIIIQYVQIMPYEKGEDWDYESLGLTRRYNVAYETDIEVLCGIKTESEAEETETETEEITVDTEEEAA